MSAQQSHRLERGGRVDRDRPIEFRFNGRSLTGYAGDTLASALLANGVRIVGRSFKYHRPRGVLSAGVEEPNALLRVDVAGNSIPLVRAPLQPLVPGLAAVSENCFPNVEFDIGRMLDFTHALWPAGFYNKTFKWPGWHLYEGFVRRAAGLGRLPAGKDRARYYHHNLHCDVLVVGAGPAGLAAALVAARTGTRVVLVDQGTELGGSLLAERVNIDGQPGTAWVERVAAELAAADQVRILRRTTVAGYYDHNVLTAVDQSDAEHADGRIERFWKIRAQQVVLTPGAIEQPLVFGHNDRPGIMLAGAVRHYLNRYAVVPGRTAVVATNNDDAYRTAIDLHDAGVTVAAIVDARERAGAIAAAAASERGLTTIFRSVVVETRGASGVREVSVQRLEADGRRVSSARYRIECDLLAMSSGWNPTAHLYSQAAGKLRYDESLACFVPDRCAQSLHVAGAVSGCFDLAQAIEQGSRAGAAAAAAEARAHAMLLRVSDVEPAFGYGVAPIRCSPVGTSSRQWVDFAHDATVSDIELAVRENYTSVEHLKRYTTIGMSVDQGKTSNLNALTILAEMTGRTIADVGTTTFRPQFVPVTIGAIGGGDRGELYLPPRLLPVHDWHVQQGAELEDYGGWKRPACYRRPAETREQAIAREVRVVREHVGLFEGSPLGKVEVRGPGAAEFLNRMYVNNMLTLQPGKVRYGLMSNEHGVVIDDGVCACLAEAHYLLSTTAANGERIAAWLDEWHQCEWTDLDLVIVPVTTQWAVLTVAGPKARALLERLDGDIDLSATAFPHMSVRAGRIDGLPARVQRVSFTGELSYEVSVPADQGPALWNRLTELGVDFGIEPIGIEAWLVLRLEKGFLHVGTDTDGTTSPLDLGFGSLVAEKQGDFVGRRSLMRAHDQREDRRQLVGLEPVDPESQLVAGAHIVSGAGVARRSEGFVTSAAYSVTLGRSIGLGLLERGRSRKGETVRLFDAGRTMGARVVEPTFYDPAGARMHA